MKIILKTLTLFFILLSLLIGCEDKEASEQELTYVKGFPEESPALTDFMKHALTDRKGKQLYNDSENLVFSSGNWVPGATTITYYQFTAEQLKEYYGE